MKHTEKWESIPLEKRAIFVPMVETARAALTGLGRDEQAICLRFSSGKVQIIFHAPLADAFRVDALVEDSREDPITQLVCLWGEGHPDLPGYALRKHLCSINPENAHAEILLNGLDCYSIKTIANSM